MNEFTIWGFIVGQRLPQHAQVGRAVIRREPDSEIERLRGGGRPQLKHPDLGDAYASATAHDILVHSQWTIAFPDISAADEDSAFSQVLRLHLPPVVSTLSIASGSHVVADLPHVQKAGETRRWSAGRVARFIPYSPELLESDAEARWRKYADAALTNSVARKACQFLYQADEGSFTAAAEERLLTGALLDYFKCIEVIANEVVARSRANDDGSLAKKHAVTKRLEDELRRKTNTGKRLEAIAQAQREIGKLDSRALKDRISQAASLLSVDDDDTAKALKLAELRNTQLGHTRDRTEGLHQHELPASSSARAFLSAYLASLV